MDAKPTVQTDLVTGRSRLASPRTALVLGALMAPLLAASVPLWVLSHGANVDSPVVGVLMVPFAAVGVVVAYRQPWNPIGWILVAFALVVTLGSDAGGYAVLAYRGDHDGLPLGRLAVALAPLAWMSVFVALPLPILLFPSGRIPAGGWRWTFWGYLALVAYFLIANGVSDSAAFTDRQIRVDSIGQLASTGHSSGGVAALLDKVFLVAYVAICLSWLLRHFVRYRRSQGDERQQLKWLLSGGSVGVIGLLAAAISPSNSAAGIAFLGVVALPLGLGMGILKYRLYEIDRLISRTISYALLTAMLVGVFAGIVALTTRVLPFSSPVAVAASTLAAAALFNPLRSRVQRLVDRRFNRARYDAEATITAFTAQLRDALDLETIRDELLHAVNRSVEPSHAALWIRPANPRSQG